MVRKDI